MRGILGGAALGAAALLAAGCAGPRPGFVNPEHDKVGIQGRTVRVLPISGVELRNSTDFDRGFRGGEAWASAHPDPVVTALFQRAWKKRLEGVNLVFDTVSASLKDTVLPLPTDRDTLEEGFAYPDSACREPGADLALSVQSLVFRRDDQAVPRRFHAYGPASSTGPLLRERLMMDGSRRVLILSGKYVLWDCRAGGLWPDVGIHGADAGHGAEGLGTCGGPGGAGRRRGIALATRIKKTPARAPSMSVKRLRPALEPTQPLIFFSPGTASCRWSGGRRRIP